MKLSHFILSALAATTLVACGNLSKINEDGQPIGDTPEQAMANLVWPKIDSASFNHDGAQLGSWAVWENLRLVKRGMNKDQLYNLLGRPHFAEGLYGVREWDYAFNYEEDGVHKLCQYKILFDKEMNAQSFFWFPNGCYSDTSFSLSTDLLFDFDKDTLTAKGKKAVDNIAVKLKNLAAQKIKVEGYTDPLGSTTYNLALSQHRADRVKARLIEQGVQAQIDAVGLGDAHQVKSCDDEQGKALKDCLSPNRRVEIKSSGMLLKQTTDNKNVAGTTGPAPLYQK